MPPEESVAIAVQAPDGELDRFEVVDAMVSPGSTASGGYFRHGNAARHFAVVRTYATDRLALFVAKRHRRARSYGWRAVVYRSPDRYGLINLNGSVVAPRPNRPWREKPNAGGEGRR